MKNKDVLVNGGWTTQETYIYIRSNKEGIEAIKEQGVDDLARALQDDMMGKLEDEGIKTPLFIELLRESINKINFNEVAEYYINEEIQ